MLEQGVGEGEVAFADEEDGVGGVEGDCGLRVWMGFECWGWWFGGVGGRGSFGGWLLCVLWVELAAFVFGHYIGGVVVDELASECERVQRKITWRNGCWLNTRSIFWGASYVNPINAQTFSLSAVRPLWPTFSRIGAISQSIFEDHQVAPGIWPHSAAFDKPTGSS